ncbi:carbohydrate-binding module family 66 protein [Annulohypoxylon truncatum]|uniref:carbohydrate-binding module family 66 protein n=1 Tax=Annulohypoxylon truncatum TaxID=327061 RepID=UPI0020073F97|nr:carbohydrate-binding module family 66 protein [Annulohypoxylon truncatum]KAI1208012.1 carbohydrate-binding module family 66 protein [Annulohypoxylon truncatum]
MLLTIMAFFSPLNLTSLLAGLRMNAYAKVASIYLLLSFTMPAAANGSLIPTQLTPENYTTAEAGNPFVDGWYADPDTEVYDGIYWVYPTSSYDYDQQTYFDAFSSSDLINWTKYSNILTTDNVTWATRAVWAPAPIFRGGLYYLYFGANDIQEGEPEQGKIGGIGVAVAERPEGPYVDAIGKPLIGEYHNGAQPIDQDVFIDDVDGQAYIYYGGHSHANVAKLNSDMISIGTFDDGTQYKEITPENYVEGSQMFKRNGIYYLMWSEGDWTGPDYSVSYAMSDSPIGPFNKIDKILQQDNAVAKSSGHNGVINVPNTDTWYIVYHRRSLSETDGNHRVLAYDRMYFNEDGTIKPVKMLVKDDFANGEMFNWNTWAGDWSVVGQRLNVTETALGRATLDTNFTNLDYQATVSITEGTGDAGLLFRVTGFESGTYGMYGYYAGISQEGKVILLKINAGTWEQIAESEMKIVYEKEYYINVRAMGSDIEVFVKNDQVPCISTTDSSYKSGATGVEVRNAGANFGFVSVKKY